MGIAYEYSDTENITFKKEKILGSKTRHKLEKFDVNTAVNTGRHFSHYVFGLLISLPVTPSYFA